MHAVCTAGGKWGRKRRICVHGASWRGTGCMSVCRHAACVNGKRKVCVGGGGGGGGENEWVRKQFCLQAVLYWFHLSMPRGKPTQFT